MDGVGRRMASGALLVALGCGGEAAPFGSDASDAAAAGDLDVAGELDVAGSADVATAPDTVGGDAEPADGGVGQTDAGDLALPDVPEAARVVVDWALQSTPGTQGLVEARAHGLADGSVLVTAVFSGVVEIDDLVLTASDDPYLHHLAVRVGPAGDLRFARHLCDGCAGAVGEAGDGRLLFADFGRTVIGAPNGPAPIDVSAAKNGPVVTRTGKDGALEAMVRIGSGEGEFTAVAATPDGGWVLGGSAFDLTLSDGTRVTPEQGGSGRALLVWLDAALTVIRVEALGGTAGSGVSMLAADPEGLVVVGDFGGFPAGETLTFGAGPDVVLESVSSDDDPALDLFVARWTAAGQVAFARRVQHYSNGQRAPTWLETTADGVTLRLDDCAALDIKDGELFCGYGDSGASLGLRFGPGGEWLGGLPLPYRAQPWPTQPHYLAVRATWQEVNALGIGSDTLTFTLPPKSATTMFTGLLLEHTRAHGSLARGGLLPIAAPEGQWPLALLQAVPQPDGSFIAVLHGASEVVLDPTGPSPRDLPNTGYERLVFARLRLVGW